ncbi:MAG: AraC family transcriptional regulator [Treponemataceae bacterium]|nr:AraC family transcriptional regulator [Treponemataceae bacterium]
MHRNVHYFYSAIPRIEVILSENSNISYPLHNHVSVITIGIVLNGFITLTKKQGVFVYKENQPFAVYPYEPHSISTDSNYTLLTLCIDKSIIFSMPMDIIRNNIISVLLAALNNSLNQKYLPQVLNQINAIINLLSTNEIYDTPFITALVKQIETHPESRISIEDMAHDTFISKFHFIRCFKAEVGLTPHQFQIQNRVRKAQRLLNSTKSLTEVALSAGFYDQSHFIKQFKKHIGLTPQSYKSAIKFISSDKTT